MLPVKLDIPKHFLACLITIRFYMNHKLTVSMVRSNMIIFHKTTTNCSIHFIHVVFYYLWSFNCVSSYMNSECMVRVWRNATARTNFFWNQATRRSGALITLFFQRNPGFTGFDLRRQRQYVLFVLKYCQWASQNELLQFYRQKLNPINDEPRAMETLFYVSFKNLENRDKLRFTTTGLNKPWL